MRRICIFTAVFDVIQITDSNTKNEKKVLYNKKKKKKMKRKEAQPSRDAPLK